MMSLSELIVSRSLVVSFPVFFPHKSYSFFWIMKGREDDNIETIRKRFNVFLESSLPVIEHYNSRGKVRKVIFVIMLVMYI